MAFLMQALGRRSVRLSMRVLTAIFLFFACAISFAQQPAASSEPLIISTTTLPRAFLHRDFRYEFKAQGGIAPYKWRLVAGNLPTGLKLEETGTLQGSPNQSGEFHFTLTATDNRTPLEEISKEFILKVVVPLLAEWGRYPKVVGQRIEGSVKVSNQTDDDLDLTFVTLAVNEIGRATAIGYQRITLKKDQVDLEIPIGENLPYGAYEVHADVVGEIAAKNSIYRAHLQSKEKLQVQQGP